MKVFIEDLIKKAYDIGGVTLIGIGPMSENVVEACMELAKEKRFPLMFIASRNQIDLKKYGGGYVRGWDQFDFVENIRKIADRIKFEDYYICRDHGGPWQRDEERNAHLSVDEAMKIAKESYAADIEAGFDLLMIDPTKDPFVQGKVVDIDFVLDKTIELIEFCEQKRKELNLPLIAYEVGTEETNGGLTELDCYNDFLDRLNKELDIRGLPRPIFAVGQTGTLVKSTVQAGHFDFSMARRLSDMAVEHGVYLKEHNADYLNEVELLEHIAARVSAANVAPEFGTMETRAYLRLCDLEALLVKKQLIKVGQQSNLRAVLLGAAIKTGRWKKWLSDKEAKMSYDDISKNTKLAEEILDIAGHYTLSETQVKKEIEKLYINLRNINIDGNEFVKDYIKFAVMRYISCFGMEGLNNKVKN